MICNQNKPCFALLPTGECDCLTDSAKPYPVGKCPFRKEKKVNTAKFIMVNVDRIEERRKRMNVSRWYMSELTGRGSTWWDHVKTSGRMRQEDAARLADVIGLRTEDILA